MDYYETLGITRTATGDEIKAAYRKEVKRHHPDNGGDAEKFRAVQRAFDCLSDEERRRLYDESGCDPEKVLLTAKLQAICVILFRHAVESCVAPHMVAESVAGGIKDKLRAERDRLPALERRLTARSAYLLALVPRTLDGEDVFGKAALAMVEETKAEIAACKATIEEAGQLLVFLAGYKVGVPLPIADALFTGRKGYGASMDAAREIWEGMTTRGMRDVYGRGDE